MSAGTDADYESSAAAMYSHGNAAQRPRCQVVAP